MQVEKKTTWNLNSPKNADSTEMLLTQPKSKISIPLLFAGVFHLNENTASADMQVNSKQRL